MARVGPISRVRAAVAATILVAGSMLVVVPMTLAGTGMSITPNIPQPAAPVTRGGNQRRVPVVDHQLIRRAQ